MKNRSCKDKRGVSYDNNIQRYMMSTPNAMILSNHINNVLVAYNIENIEKCPLYMQWVNYFGQDEVNEIISVFKL